MYTLFINHTSSHGFRSQLWLKTFSCRLARFLSSINFPPVNWNDATSRGFLSPLRNGAAGLRFSYGFKDTFPKHFWNCILCLFSLVSYDVLANFNPLWEKDRDIKKTKFLQVLWKISRSLKNWYQENTHIKCFQHEQASVTSIVSCVFWVDNMIAYSCKHVKDVHKGMRTSCNYRLKRGSLGN